MDDMGVTSLSKEERLGGAIEEWTGLLGAANVLSDEETIRRYSRTTLAHGTTPAAVLRPVSTEEVRGIVRTAARYGVGLYPISRGRNWGYGDACAVEQGQAIVDLGGMNRIIEVNPALAYAVIEPGVTQFQLYDYLRRNKIPLWLDCTGAGPEASIVGNTMERGFGHTPYGDHFLYSCGMEVVLADGRVLNTGFGHYRNAKSAHAFKWGIGPYLDGLFTQSNLGIVTKLGIWLMPEPSCFNAFFFSVPEEKDIAPVIEALRPLRLQGILKSLVHIGNDLRVISSFQRYPWERAKGSTPLPEELRKEMRGRGKFGAWNVTGALYGSRKHVAGSREELRKAVRKLARVRFVGDSALKVTKRLGNVCQYFGLAHELVGMLRSLEKVYELLRGKPTDAFLYGTLWRTRGEEDTESVDPLDRLAGLMWISPILPMTGEAAFELLHIVNPIFQRYRFEPLITVSLITERAMVAVITISYDKLSDGETEKAEECYDSLFQGIMKAGYIPYRSSIHSMSKLAMGSEVFWDVLHEIKTALDPRQVIARGRYQPVR